MRVRCRATADYRSNAVGTVELECTAAGLSVTLAGVSSYREGYAPGPPVESPAVCVPWAGVYATLLGSDELLLSLQAGRLPLNRFRLGEFAEAAAPEDAGAARARRLRWAAGAGVLMLMALGVALAARGALPYPGALRTLAAAVAIAALVAAVARAAGRRKLSSEEVLQQLSLDLARHLSHHIPSEPAAPPAEARVVPALSARLPRSAFAVAVTLAATSLAAIIGSSAARPAGGQVATGEVAAQAPPGALPGSTGQALTGAPDAPALPVLGAECGCTRDESWLWSAPVPRASPLIVAVTRSVQNARPHLGLELGLVNNGATPLVDLTLTVLFQEQLGEDGSQRQTGERTLRFEGSLEPGHAARWHVEGMGTSVDLIGPELGTLAADGSDAAPAAAFALLGASPDRSLRLHAARLLAFIGDERAKDVARSLRQAAAPGEAAIVERLLDDAGFAACDVTVARESSGQWRARACVYNRARQARAVSRARLLAFAQPFDTARPGERAPQLIAELSSPVTGELPPESGRRLELVGVPRSEESRAPRAFELVLEEKIK
jgi:hypothetical protein